MASLFLITSDGGHLAKGDMLVIGKGVEALGEFERMENIGK